MSTVGVKQLKNRLTQYLRRAKQGEEVVVTDRGKPIVLIQRIESAEQVASLEARLAKLAALGFVTLPSRRPLRQVRRAKVTGRPVSKNILEDRR
ncbi:MAG TPA: type II toxin-antitoxin system prevent-host-death family antitoxin [Methylomirabilota bacterium]|nr:type II toxin-antitoxin system prevent-host-death family antitoxin [Methylomirabilota bacterium]